MEEIIAQLIDVLQQTADECRAAGLVSRTARVTRNDIGVPRDRGHGHLATPFLGRLASGRVREPLFTEFTRRLEARLAAAGLDEAIVRVETVAPVFLNFHLAPAVLHGVVAALVGDGLDCRVPELVGRKVLVEFVSANPTGPLTIAHGRQAAFGEALSRILSDAGALVSREYYLNDEGRQVQLLGLSLREHCLAVLEKRPPVLPADGYRGDYMADIARRLVEAHGAALAGRPDDYFRTTAVDEILAGIRADLARFGVSFDSWRSQADLEREGKVEETLARLEEKGLTYHSEGATFLRTTDHGDDKDRVLRKSDGSLTYLAPDVAYHREKMDRGFEMLVNLWGPDHYGYVPRVRAALAMLGFDPGRLRPIIVQLTTLYRDGEKIPMSTRQGQFLSLARLADELTPDVAKFFFLSRKASSHLDFDLALARSESTENPVYYLQYAGARIASLFKHQREKMPGLRLDPAALPLHRLTDPAETELMLLAGQFPAAVAAAARSLEPQVLFDYLMSLVKTFQHYYQRCQVIGSDGELTTARLALVTALEKVIRHGLHLLNVSAPRRM